MLDLWTLIKASGDRYLAIATSRYQQISTLLSWLTRSTLKHEETERTEGYTTSVKLSGLR